MSGEIDFSNLFLFICVSVAVVTDLSRGKIYNWLTLPMMVLGTSVLCAHSGLTGLGMSLSGIGAGLLLFGGLFFLGVLGGGDAKLLMGLGAWVGFSSTLQIGVLSIMVGGVLALFRLVLSGEIVDFAHRMYASMVSLLFKDLAFVPPKINRGNQMPFAIPMAVATVWLLLDNPFTRWGILFR